MRRYRVSTRSLVVAIVAVVTATASFAQSVPKKQKLNRRQREELPRLMRIVDAVAESDLPGGDAWLKWSSHFLRAPDGKTYVPFTLTIDEADAGFDSIGMYIRVADRPEVAEGMEDAKLDDTSGGAVGEGPISVPERQFGQRGAPTAGENSAIAASIAASLRQKGPLKLPFEDVHFLEPMRPDPDGPWIVRRALAVAPGEYDLFIVVREFTDGKRSDGTPPRTAVLKQVLSVPDLSGDVFTTSSVVLAERVEALPTRLSDVEQLERPYALGNVEITPMAQSVFHPLDELSLVFFAYNMASAGGMPDVTVQYRFYKVGIQDQLIVAGQPQLFDASTLPAGFDVDAVGDQLPINIAVPLKSFPLGPYRLEILVTDNLADVAVTRNVTFLVEDAGE